jgi:hypothetical protein
MNRCCTQNVVMYGMAVIFDDEELNEEIDKFRSIC